MNETNTTRTMPTAEWAAELAEMVNRIDTDSAFKVMEHILHKVPPVEDDGAPQVTVITRMLSLRAASKDVTAEDVKLVYQQAAATA